MDATDGPLVIRRLDSPSSESTESYSDGQSTEAVRPKPTDLGKRSLYYSVAEKKYKYGVLRYVGEPEFAEGTWCGLELNSAVGKNNGMLQGIRYFICQPNHGVFVPIDKVEIDQGQRSHSRPNSAPSSRSPSVDRELKPSRAENESPNGGLRNKTISIQHELATRLSKQTPIHKRKTPISSSTGRMQPLKAFATRGIGREEKKEPKRVLAPFKSGGMVKAQSTENIRSLKDSNKTVLGVMPAKKSSSERDLRGGRTPVSKSKPLNRKARVNSYSDLLSPDISTSTKKKTKPSSPLHVPSRRPVSAVLPKTSTPGNRDNEPDGCSSPDDLSDSCSSVGQEPKEASSVVKTPDMCDTGFIETPESHACTSQKLRDSGNGLQTPTRQLIETERNSPSFNEPRISSPEHVTGKFYKNRPSGSATLTHPLTQHTDCAHREGLIAKLLVHDTLPEGVCLFDVLNLFREEYHHWTSKQVELEKQVQYLQQELLQMKAGRVDTGKLNNLQDNHRHTAV